MLLLGYDIGSSSIKAALLDAATGKLIASASSPKTELPFVGLEAAGAVEPTPALIPAYQEAYRRWTERLERELARCADA